MLAACSTSPSIPWEQFEDREPPPAPLSDFRNADRAENATDIIRGFFAPGRQPDGNTVIFTSGEGLVVFDTGRHAAHVQQIVDVARARDAPVAAIINSHWHLDHNSGNIPLRKLWPAAEVYANGAALGEALSGFLARGLESNRKMVADAATPAALAGDLRGDIATVEQGLQLLPTVSVELPRTLTVGGRRMELHTARAASAGDIWVHDPAGKLVAAGDIITLPAPFLDTACPREWMAAFDAILATPFERLVPGHGRVMTRADVVLYRSAFTALIECAAGDAPVAACADAWAASAAPLLDEGSGSVADARSYAAYYAGDVLRPGRTRADCAP